MKKIFEDEFIFYPYQSVGNLGFNENENDIKLKLGNVKQEYGNYGDSGKTVIFNDFDNVSVYFDIKGNFYGIHFFESIKFNLNGKLHDIYLNKQSKITSFFLIPRKEESIKIGFLYALFVYDYVFNYYMF